MDNSIPPIARRATLRRHRASYTEAFESGLKSERGALKVGANCPRPTPMKILRLFVLSVFALCGAALSAASNGEWVSLFNGKDLTGWKSNDETPGVFTVDHGVIKVSGGRAHLFYVGRDGNASFKNFEFKAKVMTMPGANSGIYFHTHFVPKGWPPQGFECQVNTSHSDPKKTGSLYAVKDVMYDAPSKDGEWFEYYVKVDGDHVLLQVNGRTTVDWTQPADWDPAKALKDMPGRKLGTGTFAIQGHDPKSTTYYKDIFVRVLP